MSTSPAPAPGRPSASTDAGPSGSAEHDEPGLVERVAESVKPQLRGWIHAGSLPFVARRVRSCSWSLSPTTAAHGGPPPSSALTRDPAVRHQRGLPPRHLVAAGRRACCAGSTTRTSSSSSPARTRRSRCCCCPPTPRGRCSSSCGPGRSSGCSRGSSGSAHPRWVYVPVYVALGWVAVGFLPEFCRVRRPGDRRGSSPAAASRTRSARSSTALKRPNPSPRWFGFHEIFHVLTVVGYACHYVAVSIASYALRPDAARSAGAQRARDHRVPPVRQRRVLLPDRGERRAVEVDRPHAAAASSQLEPDDPVRRRRRASGPMTPRPACPTATTARGVLDRPRDRERAPVHRLELAGGPRGGDDEHLRRPRRPAGAPTRGTAGRSRSCTPNAQARRPRARAAARRRARARAGPTRAARTRRTGAPCGRSRPASPAPSTATTALTARASSPRPGSVVPASTATPVARARLAQHGHERPVERLGVLGADAARVEARRVLRQHQQVRAGARGGPERVLDRLAGWPRGRR